MKIFFTFLLLLFFTTNYAQNYREVKIYLNTPSDVQQLIKAGMDFDHLQVDKDNTIKVFIDEDDYIILQNIGFRYEVLIEDWKSYYANLPIMSEEEKSLSLEKIEQYFGITGFNYGSMGGFYTLAE
ncbi:MAG TPA: hypothetical protein VLN45_01465, partial [Ignavibacteriaceae bacterium]|nr:hypothetical protein [Ignavibacteriaceae bacterium]